MLIGRDKPFTERGAFTFAEVLVAMLFLAILVPAVVEGLALGNRASVLAERTEVAAQLAEARLNELLLDDEWISASTAGDFGTAYPLYRWELERGAWREDNMTELTVRVLFTVQGGERSVVLTTLVDEDTE